MPDPPGFDRVRIIETLNRHGVQYLIVGGIGAQLHGAHRPTSDFDSLPATTTENLGRLAAALTELGAFLRVGGLSDDEARALPARIDTKTLSRLEISTWRTEAGDLDILNALPSRAGHRSGYEELAGRAVAMQVGGITVHVAALADIIESKEWAGRPKDREALPELRQLAADAPEDPR